VNLLIVIILLFIVLGECGVNLTALFATAGLLGIIIGLGAQAAIKSFIAGIGFVVQDQFSIGDFVALDITPGPLRVFGVVTAFRTQNTTVQSFDGASHYISNGMISVVTNFSKHAQRAQVDVHIPSSCTIPVDTMLKHFEQETREMAIAPQLRHKMVLPPVVKGITSNTSGTYTITVAAIAHPRAQYAVEWYIRHQLVRLLQRLQVTGTAVHIEHADQDASREQAPPDDDLHRLSEPVSSDFHSGVTHSVQDPASGVTHGGAWELGAQ
jgi:small conductance mechanosensitive channel